ncbi:ribosome maturation factor RimM [Candidatus Poriferisodalis sp.]|uniref:ribosome maturation factor RimM n=1 Tax=Candidatus Poriferisodalis sp. TaxID=3101277 RepID=UPI003B58E990
MARAARERSEQERETTGTEAGRLVSPRIRPADLLEIATIGRAHGLRGEVAVHPVTNRFERFDVGSTLVTAAGERVVSGARRDGNRWLVSFDGIVDRDGAAALTGTTLFAEPLDDPDELWVHELCGSSCIDQHGYDAGVVASVVANPAADLLELDTGHLVPLTFVVRCEPGTVHVEVPDGLFELDRH